MRNIKVVVLHGSAECQSAQTIVPFHSLSAPCQALSDLVTAKLYYPLCNITREAARAHLRSKTKTYRVEQQKYHSNQSSHCVEGATSSLHVFVLQVIPPVIYILYYTLGSWLMSSVSVRGLLWPAGSPLRKTTQVRTHARKCASVTFADPD